MTFLLIWLLCGVLGIAIFFLGAWLDDGELIITLKDVATMLVLLVGGLISLFVLSVGFFVTFKDKTILHIKKK